MVKISKKFLFELTPVISRKRFPAYLLISIHVLCYVLNVECFILILQTLHFCSIFVVNLKHISRLKVVTHIYVLNIKYVIIRHLLILI